MAAGRTSQATLTPLLRRRRPGSSTRAATAGATARPRSSAASASRTRTSTGALDTFSGGELTRASLARALGGDPDLLLLDEPTNHLDVESLEWLERELTALDAAVILVAHDRWFLEAVTNATLELSAGRATYFAGPVARLAAREGRARGARAEDRRPARGATSRASTGSCERFRYKKSKAKQAQAKLTQIGRLREGALGGDRRGRAPHAADAQRSASSS